jgi:serine/threonine protein kinase
MTGTAAGFTNAQPHVHVRVRRRASGSERRDLRPDTEKRSMSSSEARTARAATRATRAMTPRTATQPPPAPVVLDRYRLQRRLGAGAFGTVWLARDERLDRDVAVKILARERVMGGRFEREARAAARLSHPAIVTLYEATVDDEGAYLVSELVLGSTLDGLLREGRLSDRDIVAIGIALCDALEHAHAQGVVHRDVKPSNVLVPEAPASSAQVAKLTDFGVARVVGGDSLTITGDVLGTLAYMAPEQAEGLQSGEPADLYSLALVIYEALSGVNPVANAGLRPHARRLGLYLPPLRRQRRDLPRQLGQSIDMALRPRPRERGSVAELRDALAAAHDQVGDEPGMVAAPWTSLQTRTQSSPDPLGGFTEAPTPAPAPGPDEAVAAAFSWPDRGLGAAAAAALTAWLAGNALAPSPVPPAAAALVAGMVTLILPRLGWGALMLSGAAVAASQHHPGAAIVILGALLLPVLIAPARPTSWPLSAAAPALGLIGLAGAWPALAARARTALNRAALGAIGWVWVVAATATSGKVLYLPRVPGTPAAHAWMASLAVTVDGLLRTLVSTGALAPALVWAVAAVVLPWLVRGRSPALDVIRVVIWAAMLPAATTAAIAAVHGSDPIGAAPKAVIGAIAAAVIALAPLGAGLWREALHSSGSRGRVS